MLDSLPQQTCEHSRALLLDHDSGGDAAPVAQPEERAPTMDELKASMPYAFWPAEATLPEGATRPTYGDLRKAYPKLCLEPCQVETENHPGACITTELDDKPSPVCTALRGHPPPHYCVPEDAGQWEECRYCKRIISKRAIKAHIAAHEDRRTPEQIERDNRRITIQAIDAFLTANPQWGATVTDVGASYATRKAASTRYTTRGLTERYTSALRAGKDGAFWRRSLKTWLKAETSAPPVDARAAKKALGLPVNASTTSEPAQRTRSEDEAPLTMPWGDPLPPSEGEVAYAAKQKEWAQRDERARTAGHVGQPGERIDFKAKISWTKAMERDQFGERWLIALEVADGPHAGAALKWWTNHDPAFARNALLAVRATIKQHGAFKGIPETTITRAKIELAKEAP